MKHFLIVPNDGKDRNFAVTNRLKKALEEYGHSCVVCRKDEHKRIRKESIPEDIDFAIVIGGDGSLIELARLLCDREIPILGVNMGTLGYLTEVEVSNLKGAVKQLLDGDYQVEKRMMLQAKSTSYTRHVALNDVVVSRGGAIRVIRFNLYVNDVLLCTYEADGIVICTPTGSTAYNLSAGGPVVEPTASLIVVTPICSHALNNSSIVLSADDRIRIEIGEGKHGAREEVFVAFDGANAEMMCTGDSVTISRAEEETRLLKLQNTSFLEILRNKMLRS